jgi:integrase
VKAILNKGEAWGLIERNPIRRGSVPMLAVENGRLVFFEAEEWQRFITALDDEAAWRRYIAQVRTLGPVKLGLASADPRRYGGGRRPDSEATAEYRKRLQATMPLWKALLYTGSRLGEIVGLTWADVDFERAVISIRQEKTGKRKTTPISAVLREVLLALPRGVGAARVFTRPDGSAFSVREAQRAFSVARRLAGLRAELTPHSLRHTFASWLAIAGTPLRTIQELLGHRDLRMTIRYAHLSPAHLREAVEVIGTAENANRLPAGCLPEQSAAEATGAKSLQESWWPQRDSNPCRGLERAVS